MPAPSLPYQDGLRVPMHCSISVNGHGDTPPIWPREAHSFSSHVPPGFEHRAAGSTLNTHPAKPRNAKVARLTSGGQEGRLALIGGAGMTKETFPWASWREQGSMPEREA